MTETARTLADDILKAAGSGLKHYMPESEKRIIAVAQRWIDEAASKWRPIETAPKDGTRILAIDMPTHGIEMISWNGGKKRGAWHSEDGIASYADNMFSHWMPLPVHTALTQGEEA